MPFVSNSYASNPAAPKNYWTCTRTSALGPYASKPPEESRNDPDYCGQCVSYITRVCPDIPVNTSKWRKGLRVRDNELIVEGTAIATFDSKGHYHGHAAIYVSQSSDGIVVFDQWITGTGKSIGQRTIRWEGSGVSNYGNGFHVIES